jgi:hypothetical protein
MEPETHADQPGAVLVAAPWQTFGSMGAFSDLVRSYAQSPSFQYFNIPVHVTVPYVPTEGILSAINAIRGEITEVRESLERQQVLLERILVALHANDAEIEMEDVGDTEASARILELFKNSSDSLFYDDIAERLRLPLRQVVEVCNRLETEGLIGEQASEAHIRPNG